MTIQELEAAMQNMKRCGICEHFCTEHHIQTGPDDYDDSYYNNCGLKEKQDGYWSSNAYRNGTCEDWEMMK